MKNRMVCLLVVLCLIVSMLPGIDVAVNAATSDIWLNFITTRAFEPYLSNASDQEHQEINLEYAVYDVNNDGTTELLMQDEAQRPFFFTWLFAIENGAPQLVYEDYGYGMYRYSNKYNMVIGSAGFRPFSETSEAPFYSLSGTEFTLEFNIVQDLGTGYYVRDGEKREISEEERISYFEDVIWFDFIPVTELLDDQSGTDPLPTIDNSSDYADDHRVDANQESNNGTTAEDPAINAINALLTGLSYYTQEGDVSQWPDAEICSIIHRKLLDCYDPYLHERGQSTSSDDYYGYAGFELNIVQKITKDAFNREFPVDTKSSHIFVSGEELIFQCASGESPELAVQAYYQHEDIVIATGTAVYNYNTDSEFEGYFQAVLQVNPSSVYGYTLLSFKQIEPNQSFGNISAVASSELVENNKTYGAENILDGNLSTVWSEGVPGVGIGEWIKIQTTDGSRMHLSAVDFALGHQKSQEHQNKNGWSPDVLIECEGGYSQKVFFSGMEDCILLDVPVNTSWIKFTILDARAGSKYEDTCISEIILRGVDGEPYFKEYLDNTPVADDTPESENSLVVYSDYTNLSIRKGSIITLSAGILVDDELTGDVSGITFQVEDPAILDIYTTDVKDNCRYVKFEGLTEGTTTVVFNDSKTGHIATIPVTVYDDNYLSYTLNSVPTQNIDKYPTNIYNVNGLYIDSYKYTVNDDQSAAVSFDVYNTNYTYGVVEVFDENGNMKDAVLIEKMVSSNTSIKEAVWDNIGYLVRDIIDGDLLSYRQESGYSKKTSVSVKIPRNGYIKICTDPEKSFLVGFVNAVDSLMSMASLAGDIKNFDVNSKEFSEKLTKKLLAERVYVELIKDGSDASKKLWKNVGKEILITSESMGDFADTVARNIDELKLGGIIADTATDFGCSVGENVFTDLAGPAGTALKVMFSIGKVENIIIQQNDLIQSTGVGSIYIQNQGGGFRACQQVKVKGDAEFTPDTALNVFSVNLDSKYLDIIKNLSPDIYEALTKGITYTYNISLLKNGDETQPNGKVTVYIPIPESLKILAHAGEWTGGVAGKVEIYRVEEDGNLTEMDVEIEDDCFVFSTDHFSLYTIVGYASDESVVQKQEGHGSPIIVSISISAAVIIAGVAVVTIKKKRSK